ncbi:MAG TPA: ROK family protein [Steroidobacteraceae bacterium]|jgi:fructokinase|nr:ROK family protein [Steroidobacteraceae bacterium]
MPDRAAGPLYGAIEAGGTKFCCALAGGVSDLRASERFATTTPDETFAKVIDFFSSCERTHGPISAFGIGCFGPLDLDVRSASYGRILTTPKPGWSHCDLRARLRERFAIPIGLDTDVNAAALAEWDHAASGGLRSLVYVTVGTGIGGGAVIAGRSLQGPWHPEMGHIRVVRHPEDTAFAGVCPFHGDCLEGLASGPAITARWGAEMKALLQDTRACRIIGSYLGQFAATIALMLAPDRIVFGGGVMNAGALLSQIRSSCRQQLAGYLSHPLLQQTLGQFIVGPALAERSGICGAILLATASHRASHAGAAE